LLERLDSSVVWIVLLADVSGGTEGELSGELLGVILSASKEVLEVGVLALGDNSVFVLVFNGKELINDRHAGLVARDLGEEGSSIAVGSRCFSWGQEFALQESLLEWVELDHEDEAANSNASENHERVESGSHVVQEVVFSSASIWVLVA